MKLTRLQRYTAYIIMLEYYKGLRSGDKSDFMPFRGFPFGLCHVVYNLFRLEDEPGSIIFVISKFFPELDEKVELFGSPKSEKGRENRIASLKACIEETHPDNPNNKR